MIAPLPPQAGLPQPADPAGAKPDPRGDADGFAEILAAAGAAVPPPPRIPGPPPALEHGPAVMRITDIEIADPARPVEAAVQVPARAQVQAPVQAGLTDPAGEIEAPRSDQPQPAARVFNQDGFFGASVDAAPLDPAIASAADPGVPGGAAARALPAAEMPSTELAAGTGAPLSLPTAAPTGATPVATFPRLARVRPGPLTPLATARPVAFEAEAEAEPVSPSVRRFSLREPAARTAVQVAMRELEQGIHIAARAEGLDAAERVRLHDEITALLSRHGLSARSIRISAPLRGSSSQERLK